MVKRIYASGDCKVDISQYKDIVDGYSIVKAKFFTTAINVAVIKENIVDYTVNLEWDELRPLGKGMLQFVLYYANSDSAFDDGSYDQTDVKTTDFYIVSDITVEDNTATDVDVVMAEEIQENLNEVNSKVANVYTKDETYSKDEVNDLIEEGGGFIPDLYYDKEEIDGIVDDIDSGISDLESEITAITDDIGDINISLKDKQDMLECSEEGVYFANESGETFLQYTDSEGLDASNISNHMKGLMNPSVDVDELGVFFVNDKNEAFLRYDKNNGLDASQLSDHFIGMAANNKTPMVEGWADVMTNGDKLEIEVPDCKFNQAISFTAKIPQGYDIGKITICRGLSGTTGDRIGSSMIEIDSTNITIRNSSSYAVVTSAHGLSFSDFIIININNGFSDADISIMTNDQNNPTGFSQYIDFIGCRLGLWLSLSGNTAQLTECHLAWSCADLSKPIWAFGDSYFDMWPKKAISLGYGNVMFDGHGGRGSKNNSSSIGGRVSFDRCMKLGNPKMVYWCVGANDLDTIEQDAEGNITGGTINQNWLDTIQHVEEVCDTNGIELVLYTIHNGIANANTSENYIRYGGFKNDYIKASGRRYVDVAGILTDPNKSITDKNPQSGFYTGDFYDGMQANDLVHPSTYGSWVIAQYTVAQLPELKDENNI